MYACIRETGSGLFEEVCAPNDATVNLRDPPPPLSAKEPEPWQWGSGPMWITSHATVSDDLA